MVKRVAILGSTGTIGRSTLDVVRRHPDRFRVTALAAGRNVGLLARQVLEFGPEVVSIGRDADRSALARRLRGRRVEILSGVEGAEAAASAAPSDIVVSSITGIAGLRPTMAAVRAGKALALANKESMVVAGELIRREARRSGARLLPVDSEHSGVFQCLAGVRRRDVARVVLTASGGPFLRTPLRELRGRTVAQALAHPRWVMGPKVTVDSATLMNKGLELIEARWFFDLHPERLGVLIHPQSIVHALVELRDGSVLAQLSRTDMRIPIQVALTWPERLDGPLPALDLAEVRRLEFRPPDLRRFPLLATARQALDEGGSAPVTLNAANEAAVAAFLAGRLGFAAIADVVRAVLDGPRGARPRDLDDVFAADRAARERAGLLLRQRT